jgi:hypothetical protein
MGLAINTMKKESATFEFHGVLEYLLLSRDDLKLDAGTSSTPAHIGSKWLMA